MLRDHEVFRTPVPIDTGAAVAVPVPESWQPEMMSKSVKVLPLVRGRGRQGEKGWCTYVYEHADAPEVEAICGGINSKTPRAGAVWRQGNLMHFGFQPAPDEMNETGRALLVNCIVYISRFTEDHVIVRPPRVSGGGGRVFDRDRLGRLLRRPQSAVDEALRYYVAPDVLGALKGKSREQVAAWYADARDYLHANADGLLTVDAEARALGLAPARPDFFEKALAALKNPNTAATAGSLLCRYAPEGPGRDAGPEAWQTWWGANKAALFFSDAGGYRWYVDPLAKKRGVATAGLRGPARATPAPARADGGR